jgi:hypothetical protein
MVALFVLLVSTVLNHLEHQVVKFIMFLLVNILLWVQQLVLHALMATIVTHLVNLLHVLQVLFATGIQMVDLFH